MTAEPFQVGAVVAGSIAAGAAAAAIFSRYPVLVADMESDELVLPEKWFTDSIRVPFTAVLDVKLQTEERSMGRGKKYEIYNCVLSWNDNGRVQITTIASFMQRWSAEGLTEWLKLSTRLAPHPNSAAVKEVYRNEFG